MHPIKVLPKNFAPINAARGDMVPSAGLFHAERSCHDPTQANSLTSCKDDL
jgi:hypothetical protein